MKFLRDDQQDSPTVVLTTLLHSVEWYLISMASNKVLQREILICLFIKAPQIHEAFNDITDANIQNYCNAVTSYLQKAINREIYK